MSDSVRRKLCEVIQQQGRVLIDDPRRCEGLLRDLCPHDKREVHLLANALREGIPVDLGSAATRAAPAAAIARLAQKLQQDLGLAPEAARWAVESWALALGVVEAETLQKLGENAEQRNDSRPQPYSSATLSAEMRERDKQITRRPAPPEVVASPTSSTLAPDQGKPLETGERVKLVAAGLGCLLIASVAVWGLFPELMRKQTTDTEGWILGAIWLLVWGGAGLYQICEGLSGR